MQLLGAAIGAIFSIGMLLLYGAAAFQALHLLAKFLFSRTGSIFFIIFIIVILIYFISKEIKDSGIKKTIVSFFNGTDKLWYSFWIYYISLRLIINKVLEFLVLFVHEFAPAAVILNNIIFLSLSISVIRTAIRSKSFILWKGLSIVFVALIFSLNILGIYIAYKEDITLAEAGYGNILYPEKDNDSSIDKRIEDFRKTIENLLG